MPNIEMNKISCKNLNQKENRYGIPFGIKDGRFYEPRQVIIGKDCGCNCPGCGEPLIAKHCLSGKVKPHFSHLANSACKTGLETSIHLAAKQVIADARQVYLPELTDRITGITDIGREYDESISIVPAGLFEFEKVDIETTVENIKPDIIGFIRNRMLLIEIAVTHFIDHKKLDRIKELNLACIEFDLSNLERDVTFDDLTRILLAQSSYGNWIHHPKSIGARSELEGRVKKIIGVDRDIYVRHQARETDRAERKHQQMQAYQRLSSPEKLRYSLRIIGYSEDVCPAFLDIPVWKDGAFGVHRSVWQAAMFGAFIQKRYPDIPQIMFNPILPRNWLFKQLGINRQPCENSLKAVTNYLFKLTDLGIAARNGRLFIGRLHMLRV